MSINQQGQKKVYSVKEISEILGISTRTAYYLCARTQDFKVIRLGRSIRVPKESFDRWFFSS